VTTTYIGTEADKRDGERKREGPPETIRHQKKVRAAITCQTRTHLRVPRAVPRERHPVDGAGGFLPPPGGLQKCLVIVCARWGVIRKSRDVVVGYLQAFFQRGTELFD
jgi:hypothetical protein